MNILFVCTGNTCRSPMAEGYLKSLELKDVSVRSRGLAAAGGGASQNAVEAMREKGIDISGHVSRQIGREDLAWADRIICMSDSHKTALEMFAQRDKISVLSGGVPDPYGGDISRYRQCRDCIFKGINDLADRDFFFDIQVTTVKREHLKDIAALEKICFSRPWSLEAILESYSRGTVFFTAERNDKVLGYIGINCVMDEGYITNIAVFPEFRRMGVATALLERVFSLAGDRGLSFVSLEVRPGNEAALNLYKKLGFKEEGRRRDFYSDPKEDALIMTKRFD